MAGKMQGQKGSSRDQDKNVSMKGNLGQQDAQRDKRSDSDIKHMGDRSKSSKQDDE